MQYGSLDLVIARLMHVYRLAKFTYIERGPNFFSVGLCQLLVEGKVAGQWRKQQALYLAALLPTHREESIFNRFIYH